MAGSNRFVELQEGQQIPVGSVVDTTKGRVTIVAAGGQSADFFDGIFRLSQTQGREAADDAHAGRGAQLPEGGQGDRGGQEEEARGCGATGAASSRPRASTARRRSSARRWLVEDRCDEHADEGRPAGRCGCATSSSARTWSCAPASSTSRAPTLTVRPVDEAVAGSARIAMTCAVGRESGSESCSRWRWRSSRPAPRPRRRSSRRFDGSYTVHDLGTSAGRAGRARRPHAQGRDDRPAADRRRGQRRRRARCTRSASCATRRVTSSASAAARRGSPTRPYNDGGVTYGPGGVLFLARWPLNELGQTKPGSAITDKIIPLTPLGIESLARLAPVRAAGPAGRRQPQAGQLPRRAVVRRRRDRRRSRHLRPGQRPRDAGLEDRRRTRGLRLRAVRARRSSAARACWSPSTASTRSPRTRSTPTAIRSSPRGARSSPGLDGAEGALLDPVTGDFLFSTFGGGSRVIVVRGFRAPPPQLPPPVAGKTVNAFVVSGKVRIKRREARSSSSSQPASRSRSARRSTPRRGA